MMMKKMIILMLRKLLVQSMNNGSWNFKEYKI